MPKSQDIIMLLVAAFVLGLLLGQGTATKSNDVVREKQIIRARPDTVRTVIEVPMHPIAVRAQRNRVSTIVLHDTLMKAACLDTLISSDTSASAPDTLSICYAEQSFALSLALAPRKRPVTIPYIAHDTFYWRDNSIDHEAPGGRAWYADALLVIVSIAAGIIVGKL